MQKVTRRPLAVVKKAAIGYCPLRLQSSAESEALPPALDSGRR